MAERRMFSKKITDSDSFVSLPSSAQALYFHLNQGADDDGFNNQIQSAMFKAHATAVDFDTLLASQFILRFESGVIVIKHWKMHNYIKNDRYKETAYQEEKAMLEVKQNKSYSLSDTNCIQNVSKMDTQVRLGKDRLELGEDSIGEIASPAKPAKHKHGQYNNVLLTDEEYSKLQSELPGTCELYIERLSEYMESSGKHYKSHLATIRNWARKDKEKGVQKEAERNPFMKYANEYAGNSEDTSGFEAELPAGF